MRTRVLIISTCIMFFALYVFAQQLLIIKVDEIQICKSVEDNEPVGIGQWFKEDVEQIYCFTKLRSNVDVTSISHVWYYDDKVMANVKLPMNARSWRTWSSKKIIKGRKGNWRVDVLSPSGELLASKSFRIYRQLKPEEKYVPQVGQGGKDVVWIPTSQALVDEMLAMAKVTPEDYVIDLGSGDGVIVISVAKLGARGLGIEYNPYLVEYSKRKAAEEGVSDKAIFDEADLFKTDFSDATVLTLALTQKMNEKLRPKILDMKPGTRIVSNTWNMGEWAADNSVSVDEDVCSRYCVAYLWIVPAKVEGTWELPQGELIVEQNFQMITGNLSSNGVSLPINGKMVGDQINFIAEGKQYTGQVRGNKMDLKINDGSNTRWTANRLER